MTFTQLGLHESILKALSEAGYAEPTPIQAQAIPPALEGRDLLACAQTGTGKTAAFSLPMLDLLSRQAGNNPGRRPIQALILTPTRELAIQIGESLEAYGKYLKLYFSVIYGGVSQRPQEKALRRGVDILVATPGRLLDLMNQGIVHLGDLQFFVLDEADRMLDMGFVHDVRRVLKVLPAQRQSLFFSATMPKAIIDLAGGILHDPVRVEVTPPATTVELIDQSVYFVEKRQKRHLLKHLLESHDIDTALVFTRTKHAANKVAQGLTNAGIQAEAIHGNKSQNARQQALSNFKRRRTRVLVATDIASRGIDVDALSHVINYDLPNEPETYVHRIGRTGRAGESGVALSFCDVEEKTYLRDIVRLIKHQIPVVEDHPFPMNDAEVLAARENAPAPSYGRGGGGGGRGPRGGGGARGGSSRRSGSGGGNRSRR
jgi:ATP-dependent RNA helicase RhlE